MKFPLSSQLGEYVDFEEDVGPPVEKASTDQVAQPGASAANSEDDSSSESNPNDDDEDVEPASK
jgi:hypothetical protein